MSKAVLTLIDAGGQRSKSIIDGATVANVVTFFATNSDAGVTGGNTVTVETVTPTVPVAGSNVDKKAICTFKNGDGKIFRVAIPAPNSSAITTELTEKGERVTAASGATLAASYGTLIGETLTFLRGSIIQRS